MQKKKKKCGIKQPPANPPGRNDDRGRLGIKMGEILAKKDKNKEVRKKEEKAGKMEERVRRQEWEGTQESGWGWKWVNRRV